jgi:hypothetical protein
MKAHRHTDTVGSNGYGKHNDVRIDFCWNIIIKEAGDSSVCVARVYKLDGRGVISGSGKI